MAAVKSVLARHRLKLLNAPIQRVAAHRFEQFRGCVYTRKDTTCNIISQYEFDSLPIELSAWLALCA